MPGHLETHHSESAGVFRPAPPAEDGLAGPVGVLRRVRVRIERAMKTVRAADGFLLSANS